MTGYCKGLQSLAGNAVEQFIFPTSSKNFIFTDIAVLVVVVVVAVLVVVVVVVVVVVILGEHERMFACTQSHVGDSTNACECVCVCVCECECVCVSLL